MPSQRRTLPENGTSSVRRSPRGYRSCSTCRQSVPSGSLVGGQCPDCAGLQPLPLGGEGGRFLPGLTPSSSSSADANRRGAQ
jgi:hypothetical protein